MKKFFKRLFFQIRFSLSASNNFLFVGYYKFLYRPKKESIEQIISVYSKSIGKDFTLIQIGANDGITHDPVHKFIKRDNWKGVLLEPQKYVFEKFLQRLYRKNKTIHVLNAALGKEDGLASIYKIGFSQARWATGLTTFDKATLEKAFENGHVERKCKKEGLTIPENSASHIVEEQVQIIATSTLLKKYDISQIHMLMIDTEGFDFEVIKMFDLDVNSPGIIVYENTHLSDEDYEACSGYLINHNYNVEKFGANTIAIHAIVKKSLPIIED